MSRRRASKDSPADPRSGFPAGSFPVRFSREHTHRGVLYAPGDSLLVTQPELALLLHFGVIHPPEVRPARPGRSRPLDPIAHAGPDAGGAATDLES